jgi:hypothetical protein
MEPAATIIRLLGGVSAVAKRRNLHRTRVSKWQAPRSAGGTDGAIPMKHIQDLIEMGRDIGVELTAEDFIPQRDHRKVS